MANSASVLNRQVNSSVEDIVHTRSVLISETAAGTSFTAAIPIPAGSIVLDVMVIPEVLWTADTSASMVVGDTASANGFFTATNLKATDLVLGERLQAASSSNWGGVNGAYLVSATGRFGAASGNGVSGYYATADTITATVTRVGTAGAAGRTRVVVRYTPLFSIAANT